jgi:Tfp pilus assembly protein PilO
MQILQKTNYGVGKFIVTTGIALLVFIFLVLPKFSEFRTNSQNLKLERNLEEKLRAEDIEITKRLATLEGKKDGVALLELAIPSTPDIPDLYAHLETLVKTSNLTMTAVQAVDQTKTGSALPPRTPLLNASGAAAQRELSGEAEQTVTVDAGSLTSLTSAPSPSLGVVTVNVEAIGDMNGYKQFLSGLETTLRIIDVQSVEINESDEGKLRFRVVLKTYYQKQK